MARSKAYWKARLLAAMGTESAVSEVDSTSRAAEWMLWIDLVAFCMFLLDGFFDLFRQDVNTTVAAERAHGPRWYASMAKRFQYGVALPADKDVYAVVPPVDASVLVVAHAAVVEFVNTLRIKVAKSVAGVRGPLSDSERDALEVYLNKVKDSGVKLDITTGDGDNLRLAIVVYYDPLILDSAGKRLDGTDDAPLLGAVNGYVDGLDFDVVFVLNDLIAVLRGVEGIPNVSVMAEANFGATPYLPIVVEYPPDAGYLVVDEVYFLAHVVYVPH